MGGNKTRSLNVFLHISSHSEFPGTTALLVAQLKSFNNPNLASPHKYYCGMEILLLCYIIYRITKARHTLRDQNAYWFSTATIATRTRFNFTFYIDREKLWVV
jgi:hypothetical protein